MSLPAAREQISSPVCCFDPPICNNHPDYTALLPWGRCSVSHGSRSSRTLQTLYGVGENIPKITSVKGLLFLSVTTAAAVAAAAATATTAVLELPNLKNPAAHFDCQDGQINWAQSG